MKHLEQADTRNHCFADTGHLTPIFFAELMGRNTNEYNHNCIICNKKALKGNG